MRAKHSSQVMIVFALYVLRFMLICGGDATDNDAQHDYEIMSVDEYNLLANERYSSQRRVFSCNFDSGWCGFQNEKNKLEDDFDWTLTSKSTPSVGTGPKHDLSGKGSYIFIETSLPRRLDDKAKLASPILPQMIYCLQFGLHAYGENIGALVVYKKDVHNNKRELLLKLYKNNEKKWQYVMITVAHTSRFQIEFEGVCGNGYQGDIALDNIALTEGICEIGNKTDICGLGYPRFTNKIPLANHAWPWLAWLGVVQSQPFCLGVQVSREWLLTTADCAGRFSNNSITVFTDNRNRRKNVLKIEKTSTSVLLQVNSSARTNGMAKVCLPSNIPWRHRVTDCHLLASRHGQNFVESPAIILSGTDCKTQTTFKTKLDFKNQLCVQVNNSSHFKDSVHYFGYVVCKNEIMKRWILQAMGSFSSTDFKKDILVLRRVSFDVDWIDNITQVPILSPDIPADLVSTTPIAITMNGFQIMEKAKQECLTFVLDRQRFRYTPCNELDTLQRFYWNREQKLILVHTNTCVAADSSHLHNLRVDRCSPRRRSQEWTCKENTILNIFYNSYITLKSHDDDSGFVRLARATELIGHLVISGTQDDLCSLRPTVEGTLKCDFNHERSCGFDGVDSYAQYMWRVSRIGSNDYKKFPRLLPTDKFFRVVRRTLRGPSTAVLRSPWFHGQRCAEFHVLLHTSSHNQLNVYKSGRESRVMFQRNATNDNIWRFHRVTIVPRECEAFQVVFEVVFSNFGKSKVALRDIVISPGACRPPRFRSDGKCLEGWKFVNGQCMYFHDTKATWHEASAVCHIVGAELASHTAALSNVIPRGRPAWFGARSCPTKRLYSVKGIPYAFKSGFSSRLPVCLQVNEPHNGATIYQTSHCGLKISFACQKDPATTSNACGWRNTTALHEGQWPWHVLIVVYDRCVCGGTLIAPGYVVTSSLCLSRVWLQTIKLFFPSSQKVVRRITKIIKHPTAGIKSGDNDISIVIFEDKSPLGPSIHFACVNKIPLHWTNDNDNLLKGKKCIVLGWGTFQGSHRTCGPSKYAAHEIEIVTRKECGEYYGEHMITERMICARATNQTSGKCLGDTGGPLVCNITGCWTLVGVTSWGVGCSSTRKYGIYTDVGSMKPWMDIIARENQL